MARPTIREFLRFYNYDAQFLQNRQGTYCIKCFTFFAKSARLLDPESPPLSISFNQIQTTPSPLRSLSTTQARFQVDLFFTFGWDSKWRGLLLLLLLPLMSRLVHGSGQAGVILTLETQAHIHPMPRMCRISAYLESHPAQIYQVQARVHP